MSGNIVAALRIANPLGFAAAALCVASDVVEKIIDHCRDKVQPVEGSILYCDLGYGFAEHSGVYIGNEQIVHLNGRGRIEIVCPDEFIAKWNYDHAIYVSCRDTQAVGSQAVAECAYNQVGTQRTYT